MAMRDRKAGWSGAACALACAQSNLRLLTRSCLVSMQVIESQTVEALSRSVSMLHGRLVSSRGLLEHLALLS